MTRLALVSFCLAALAAAPAAAQDVSSAYRAIYDDILVSDAAATVESCKATQAVLGGDATDEARKAAFTTLAENWGRVEAIYVLGGYDMDAMDYPLFVDSYHSGNEDIHVSLARIIEGDKPPAKALYKNSYTSIGALDDILFSGPWSPRRRALAETVTASLCRNFERIHGGYVENRDAFLADPDRALSLLLNAQVQSIYKTSDWRIAEVAGLTKKTLGQFHPENLQYPWSGASWPVIGAILDTHWRLVATDRAPNLSTIATQSDAASGLLAVQDMLEVAIEAYNAVPPGEEFATKPAVPIVNALQRVKNAFYNSLALSLGLTLGLVAADGD